MDRIFGIALSIVAVWYVLNLEKVMRREDRKRKQRARAAGKLPVSRGRSFAARTEKQ